MPFLFHKPEALHAVIDSDQVKKEDMSSAILFFTETPRIQREAALNSVGRLAYDTIIEAEKDGRVLWGYEFHALMDFCRQHGIYLDLDNLSPRRGHFNIVERLSKVTVVGS